MAYTVVGYYIAHVKGTKDFIFVFNREEFGLAGVTVALQGLVTIHIPDEESDRNLGC